MTMDIFLNISIDGEVVAHYGTDADIYRVSRSLPFDRARRVHRLLASDGYLPTTRDTSDEYRTYTRLASLPLEYRP